MKLTRSTQAVSRRVPLSVFIIVSLLCVAFTIILTLFFRNQYVAGTLFKRLTDGSTQKTSFEDLDELWRTIAAHETEIERCVGTTVRTGLYWKLLATRLMDRGLYGPALSALEKAVYYHPNDASLQYSIGISAAYLAKASQDFSLSGENSQRDALFRLAESAQLQASAMDGKYANPLYALAVLYVFELARPAEAIAVLERYLELRKNDFEAYFILAAANYIIGNTEEALALYDNIIASSQDPLKRAEAAANKQTILDAEYD